MACGDIKTRKRGSPSGKNIALFGQEIKTLPFALLEVIPRFVAPEEIKIDDKDFRVDLMKSTERAGKMSTKEKRSILSIFRWASPIHVGHRKNRRGAGKKERWKF